MFVSGSERYALSSHHHIQLAQVEFPAEFAEKGKCDRWTYRLNWLEAKNVSVQVLQAASPEYFGLLC
jgi:hypothetical protein